MNEQTCYRNDNHFGKRRAVLSGFTFGFLLLTALILAACSSSSATATPLPADSDTAVHNETEEHGHAEEEEQHEEPEEEHGHSEEEEEHEHSTSAAHMVPDDAAAVPNPVPATDESVESGAALFATTCAVCHGETGMGDGPSAAGLDPKPANLGEDHVQDLSDGALFYIISNGVEGTAMVAWDGSFSEEEIWHLVNYLRTFHHHE